MLKYPVEMREVFEPRLEGDGNDRLIRSLKQVAGVREPELLQIFLPALVGDLAE